MAAIPFMIAHPLALKLGLKCFTYVGKNSISCKYIQMDIPVFFSRLPPLSNSIHYRCLRQVDKILKLSMCGNVQNIRAFCVL